MGFPKWVAVGLFWLPLLLRAECPSTPAYSACDISFDLNDAEAKAHPNPYTTVEIHALGEFSVIEPGGTDVTPPGLSAKALRIVVGAGGPVHQEELADRL